MSLPSSPNNRLSQPRDYSQALRRICGDTSITQETTPVDLFPTERVEQAAQIKTAKTTGFFSFSPFQKFVAILAFTGLPQTGAQKVRATHFQDPDNATYRIWDFPFNPSHPHPFTTLATECKLRELDSNSIKLTEYEFFRLVDKKNSLNIPNTNSRNSPYILEKDLKNSLISSLPCILQNIEKTSLENIQKDVESAQQEEKEKCDKKVDMYIQVEESLKGERDRWFYWYNIMGLPSFIYFMATFNPLQQVWRNIAGLRPIPRPSNVPRDLTNISLGPRFNTLKENIEMLKNDTLLLNTKTKVKKYNRLVKHFEEFEKRFTCPISHTFINIPVTTTKGSTYDKESIENWLKRGNITDPFSNEPLLTEDKEYVFAPNMAFIHTMNQELENFEKWIPAFAGMTKRQQALL